MAWTGCATIWARQRWVDSREAASNLVQTKIRHSRLEFAKASKKGSRFSRLDGRQFGSRAGRAEWHHYRHLLGSSCSRFLPTPTRLDNGQRALVRKDGRMLAATL